MEVFKRGYMALLREARIFDPDLIQILILVLVGGRMVGRLHVPVEEGEDAVEELVEGGGGLLGSLHLLL